MTPPRARRRLVAFAVLVLTALPAVSITDADVAQAADTMRWAASRCPVSLPPLALEVAPDPAGRLGWFDGGVPVVHLDWRVPTRRLAIVVVHEVVHACWYWSGGPWRNERAVQHVALRWLGERR